MSHSKYIIFDTPGMDNVPVIFPCYINHSDFARQQPESWKPVSAGFVSVGVTKDDGFWEPTVSAYGKSESLKLSSRPGDTNTLKRLFDL